MGRRMRGGHLAAELITSKGQRRRLGEKAAERKESFFSEDFGRLMSRLKP